MADVARNRMNEKRRYVVLLSVADTRRGHSPSSAISSAATRPVVVACEYSYGSRSLSRGRDHTSRTLSKVAGNHE
eukprot:scaffold338275_cov18-Prasinocladus_malaysianus.AAC.1